MPNTNNKIPTISLNKSDICNNNEHPIPSQELNPSSQNIPQTRCSIFLINRPRPCCCRDFSVALFLSWFFCHTFFATIFLPWFFVALFRQRFFYRTFSATIFLLHFFCRDFSTALFLPQFFCRTFSATIFLPRFFSRTFSAAIFLPQFFCHTFPTALFSINNTCPNNLSQNRYSIGSSVIKWENLASYLYFHVASHFLYFREFFFNFII